MINWIQRHKVLTMLIFLAFLLLAIYLIIFTPRDRDVLLSSQHTFMHDEIERSYITSLPEQTTKDSKIIVGLHGFGDSPRRFAYYTALHNVVDTNDLVVYPAAVSPRSNQEKSGWNAGFCCGSGWVNQIDDSGFIVKLVQALAVKHEISLGNVFVTGFSNGGFMAQRLIIDHPDVFKGASIGSGSIGTKTNKLNPMTPKPILLMHGEQDTIVPFKGGVGSSDPDFEWLDFNEAINTWQSNNKRDQPVKVITYPENGHQWDGWRLFNFWRKKPDASIQTIQFFDSL